MCHSEPGCCLPLQLQISPSPCSSLSTLIIIIIVVVVVVFSAVVAGRSRSHNCLVSPSGQKRPAPADTFALAHLRATLSAVKSLWAKELLDMGSLEKEENQI